MFIFLQDNIEIAQGTFDEMVAQAKQAVLLERQRQFPDEEGFDYQLDLIFGLEQENYCSVGEIEFVVKSA